MNYLGADETAPGSLLTQTDFDTVVERLIARVNLYLQDIPWSASGPKEDLIKKETVERFLAAFISVGRKTKVPYDGGFSSLSLYSKEIGSYGIERAVTYLKYFKELADEGMIPEPILQPWTYTPPKDDTPLGGLLRGLGGAADATLSRVLVVGGIGLLAYFLIIYAAKNGIRRKPVVVRA